MLLALAGCALAWSTAAILYARFYGDQPVEERRWCRFLICDSGLLTRTSYQQLIQGGAAGVTAAVDGFREAVSRDPASAYRWCELGEALLEFGQVEQANYCFGRAAELGPNIPPILMRVANFHFRVEEPREAMRCTFKILKEIPDYDAIIFSSYTRMGIGLAEILQVGLPEDRRATRSYFRYLLQQGSVREVEPLWNHVSSHSFDDDELAGEYLDFLLRKRQFETAVSVWAGHARAHRGDYPGLNRLFNGGFEFAPTGAILDWRITPCDGAVATRDSHVSYNGNWSLRISFSGEANPDFKNVCQRSVVQQGSYRFQARIRGEVTNTDLGVGFRILDAESPSRLDFTTENVVESQDWRAVGKTFVVPQETRLIEIQVVRRPSLKFGNQIRGTVWIDDLMLAPVVGGRAG